MAPNTPPPASSPMAGQLNTMMGRLSQGEQLIVIGGLLVLVVGDLLGALLGAGGIGITTVLASTTVLVAIYLRHSARTPLLGSQLYAVVLVVLTALVAVPALENLLQSLHGLFANESALDVLFAIAYWVGAGLMAWGAYTHWRATAA